MNHNLTADQRFIISHFKDMYESNNRVLNSITNINIQNFNSETINNLINNLITSNNEIMRNITNLLNTNNRQQNNIRNQNRHQSNRQNNNNRYNNYINESFYNYANSRPTDAGRISNLIYSFLEPIEIYPTLSQIESATRTVRFGDIIRPLNTACPISLENFNENDQVLIIRHCNHIFSNTGLISWFRSNCRCPVCRYDIRNYVSTRANNNSSLSNNTDISSNVLPSSLTSVERRNISNPTNILFDLIFSNLLDTRNVTDESGNNVSTTNNESNTNNLPAPSSIAVSDNSITTRYDISDISDLSGNLLHYFFTPHNSHNSHK